LYQNGYRGDPHADLDVLRDQYAGVGPSEHYPFFNLKDLWQAKESLVESLKLIRASDNTPEKSIALLRSVRVITRVDQAMIPGIAEETWGQIGALNFIEKIERVEFRTVAGLAPRKGILALAKTEDATSKKRATKL